MCVACVEEFVSGGALPSPAGSARRAPPLLRGSTQQAVRGPVWRCCRCVTPLREALPVSFEPGAKEVGDTDLLLTFNSPGLGYGRGHTSRQDILR